MPVDLERVINRTLEKDRELRYQSASDLRCGSRESQTRRHDGLASSLIGRSCRSLAQPTCDGPGGAGRGGCARRRGTRLSLRHIGQRHHLARGAAVHARRKRSQHRVSEQRHDREPHQQPLAVGEHSRAVAQHRRRVQGPRRRPSSGGARTAGRRRAHGPRDDAGRRARYPIRTRGCGQWRAAVGTAVQSAHVRAPHDSGRDRHGDCQHAPADAGAARTNAGSRGDTRRTRKPIGCIFAAVTTSISERRMASDGASNRSRKPSRRIRITPSPMPAWPTPMCQAIPCCRRPRMSSLPSRQPSRHLPAMIRWRKCRRQSGACCSSAIGIGLAPSVPSNVRSN